MNRRKASLPVVLAAFIFSALLTAAPQAFAWTRTIMYIGPILSFSTTRTQIAFPSDGTGTGVPTGNGASTIYVDFSTVGGSSATNVTLQACAIAYNGSGGGCGAANTANYTAGSYYDVAIAKWLGTGSAYDYFYVTIINNNAGALQPVGIGVTGT
jgi:hypothetical protein